MTALPNVEDEARRVLQVASNMKVDLKLIGGVAIATRCPSSRLEVLKRNYVDIDLVGREKQSGQIKKLFVDLQYSPRDRFNALMGHKRLIFNDLTNHRRVDIFLDVFEMCHKLDFSKRVGLEPLTLPLADLLATKLQIVQINDKDFKDLTTMLLDHPVESGDGESINGSYIARLCSNDWGLHKTLMTNLSNLSESLDESGLQQADLEKVKARIGTLTGMIDMEPKSLAWKIRARVGERVPWYELPEADKPVVAGSFD